MIRKRLSYFDGGLLRRALFASCAFLALGAGARAEGLTHGELVRQATAKSLRAQVVQRQPDGRIKMSAPIQDLEAFIGPDGLRVRSIGEGGTARLAEHVRSVGRQGTMRSAMPGVVRLAGGRVKSMDGPLTQEFSTNANGIRQDFILTTRLPGSGPVRVDLTFVGARLGVLPASNDKAVVVSMTDGRKLHYHDLQAIDATGRVLPARMELLARDQLRIEVDDSNAGYPIRIDPTFSDADWMTLAVPGFDGSIMAFAVGNGDLFVGGDFSVANGGVPANNVAMWNGTTWTALGSGTDSRVYALAWDPVNERLYAGGSFTTAGGSPALHIAVGAVLGNEAI